jgi:hypothetical protein
MEARNGRLAPVDTIGADSLDAVPVGTVLRVKWSRPRNAGHHRKFFALLNVVFKAQSRFATLDDLLDAIKIATGHYTIWRVGDREILRPKSISFAAMDQTAFEQFYERVVALILETILPNVERADLDAEVHEILEGRRPAA